jgi:hypothetical protein
MVWRRKGNCKATLRARSVCECHDLAAVAQSAAWGSSGGGDRIAELQLENSRLRRLVTDLLLEKIKLEETAQRQKGASR